MRFRLFRRRDRRREGETYGTPANDKQVALGRALPTTHQLTTATDYLGKAINLFTGASPGRNGELMRRMRELVPTWNSCINRYVDLMGWIEYDAEDDRVLAAIQDFDWNVAVNAAIKDTDIHTSHGLAAYVKQQQQSWLEQGMCLGERLTARGGKGGITGLYVADPLTLDLRSAGKGTIALYQWVKGKLQSIALPRPHLIDVVGCDFRYGDPYGVPLGYGMLAQVPPILSIWRANLKQADRQISPPRFMVVKVIEGMQPEDAKADTDALAGALKDIAEAELRGETADTAAAVKGEPSVPRLVVTPLRGVEELLKVHLSQLLSAPGLASWMAGLGPWGTTERLSSNERRIIEAIITHQREVAETLIDRCVGMHLNLLGMGAAEWGYKWPGVTLGGDEEHARAMKDLATAEKTRRDANRDDLAAGIIDMPRAQRELDEIQAETRMAKASTQIAPRIKTARRYNRQAIGPPKPRTDSGPKQFNTRLKFAEAQLVADYKRRILPLKDEVVERMISGMRLEEPEHAREVWMPAEVEAKIAAWLHERDNKYGLYHDDLHIPWLPGGEERRATKATGLTARQVKALEDALDWLERELIGTGSKLATRGSVCGEMAAQGVKVGFAEGQIILRLLGRGGRVPIRIDPDFEYVLPLRRFAMMWVKDPFIWTTRHKALDILHDAIGEGLYPKDVAVMLRAEMGYDLWRWERLARTEIAAALDSGMVAAYEADGVPYERWEGSAVACEVCAQYIGEVWKLSEGPRVGYDTHPNCRCSRIPEFRKPRTLQPPFEHSLPWRMSPEVAEEWYPF